MIHQIYFICYTFIVLHDLVIMIPLHLDFLSSEYLFLKYMEETELSVNLTFNYTLNYYNDKT